jgi:hypothetical protein
VCVCVIQYGTGCVGRSGVHSISEEGGKSVDLELFFFSLYSQGSRMSHKVTQQKIIFRELDTRRNERPCPKKLKKKSFEKIMSSKLLTDAE